MPVFELHPRLAADCYIIGDLPLCCVMLQNNHLFPWLVMVPRINGLREIIDLSVADRARLMDEIAAASEVVTEVFQPHKLNIAALGNVVEQLHIHVIARFTHDAAWPHPVWGKASVPYLSHMNNCDVYIAGDRPPPEVRRDVTRSDTRKDIYNNQQLGSVLEKLQKAFAKRDDFVRLGGSFCSPPC